MNRILILKILFILSKVRRRETQRPTRGTRALPQKKSAPYGGD